VKSKNGVIFFAVNGLVRSVQEQCAFKAPEVLRDFKIKTSKSTCLEPEFEQSIPLMEHSGLGLQAAF
jgi:hypothetical protein